MDINTTHSEMIEWYFLCSFLICAGARRMAETRYEKRGICERRWKLKVKVKIRFRDSENDLKIRKENEVFEVTEERARYLENLFLVEPLERKGDPNISL